MTQAKDYWAQFLVAGPPEPPEAPVGHKEFMQQLQDAGVDTSKKRLLVKKLKELSNYQVDQDAVTRALEAAEDD